MKESTDDLDYVDGVPVQKVPLEELRMRARRLQELMRESGFDGLMATHNADMLYLSGVVQQGQVYLPTEGDPLLMVRKHAGRAHLNSALQDDRIVDVRSLRQLPELITPGNSRPRRIGFTFDTLPVAVFSAYAKALSGIDAELADAGVLFRKARAIKSGWEVEHVRRAARVADAGVQAAREHLRDGVTEVALAAHVEAATRIAGHSGAIRIRAYGQEMHMGHLLAGSAGALPSFMNSPTGGYGPGPWAPYGAGARPIGRGEPVLLDYSGEWSGYIADQTRMLSIGPLSHFWRDAYAAMLDVLYYLQTQVKPGITSGDVYTLALARATELGYSDNFMGPPEEESPGQKVSFVGHAVGLELDEWPPLQRGTDALLEVGMVLAVEPKLIFTGRGAIGIEDTYLLTESGLEPLTYSTHEIIEV
jgi:Xaa-Pro dipeptidase